MFQIKTRFKRKLTFLLTISGKYATYHTAVCIRRCIHISGILQWGPIIEITEKWAEKCLASKTLRREFYWYARWYRDDNENKSMARTLQTTTIMADGSYSVDDYVVTVAIVDNI